MDVFLMSLTLCNLPCFLRAPTLAHLGSAAKYLLLAVLALGLIELSVFCHLYEEERGSSCYYYKRQKGTAHTTHALFP